MRKSNYTILDVILNRHSARAMSGKGITKDELFTLLEAARWAQSSFNNQPWRFVYAFRDTPYWDIFFELLVPANKVWCKNGGAFVVAISHRYFSYNGLYSRTHSFDTGAALENFSIQGCSMNLVVHGLEGFDYDQARVKLAIPEGYDIEAMFVVGKPGSLDTLPAKLQAREELSDRKPLEELAFEGIFRV